MKIAVSACLLGRNCRYDGSSKPCQEAIALSDCHEVVPICPECAAGLRIPHAPNEIVAGAPELRVVDSEGRDNTEAFVRGARLTLERVLGEGCELAVLKSKSPSCGVGLVYDGTFSGTLVPGYGVAAQMLADAGVRVVDEGGLEGLAGEIGTLWRSS